MTHSFFDNVASNNNLQSCEWQGKINMKSEVIGKFVPTHAMKACGGSEGTFPPMLKLSTRQRWEQVWISIVKDVACYVEVLFQH